MPVEWLAPERLTLTGLLVVILITGMRGDWTWGWTYREMRDRAARFEELALKTLALAERMTDIVEQARRDRNL